MMDYRNQRRAYRRQFRYGGYYGRINGLVWPVAILLFIFTHSWIWFPLAIFAPMILAAIFGSVNQGPMQQQQPYYQPTYQPDQPIYQPPYQPQPTSESEQPVYQPYEQGYTPQQPVHEQPEIHQGSEPQEQYPVQQQNQQQYEDPMVMYPQE